MKCPECKDNIEELIHTVELEFKDLDLEERVVHAYRCPHCYCFIANDRYTAYQFLKGEMK